MSNSLYLFKNIIYFVILYKSDLRISDTDKMILNDDIFHIIEQFKV